MKLRSILATLAAALFIALPAAAQSADPQVYAQSYSLEAQGDYGGALSTLDKLSSAQRSGYVYSLRRAWLLYLNGRYDDAIASYDRAIKAQPGAIEPLLGKMLPELALRKWADVQATAGKALSLDADNYLATSRLAYSLYNLGRYAEAEKHYARLVTLYPADVEMKAGWAWALLKQGKAAQAKPLFAQILAVAPTHASALEGAAQTR